MVRSRHPTVSVHGPLADSSPRSVHDSFAGLSPTLHEVGFGLLVTLGTARITYLLHVDKRLEGKNAQRAQAVGLFKRGIASFLTGFAVRCVLDSVALPK